jgi:hypothetical protein
MNSKGRKCSAHRPLPDSAVPGAQVVRREWAENTAGLPSSLLQVSLAGWLSFPSEATPWFILVLVTGGPVQEMGCAPGRVPTTFLPAYQGCPLSRQSKCTAEPRRRRMGTSDCSARSLERLAEPLSHLVSGAELWPLLWPFSFPEQPLTTEEPEGTAREGQSTTNPLYPHLGLF